MTLSILSKYSSTKHKALLAEPFGRSLWGLSPALSASRVGQLHVEASALYKVPTSAAKIITKGQQTLDYLIINSLSMRIVRDTFKGCEMDDEVSITSGLNLVYIAG
ncbi:hypothetical protein GCE9029_04544 [Grimontia celer]|uniref:Uncharacterized protein n=1 Tax=Grimontia celer TaxID=1796497 RepID=A0A128FD56_9GAMM|nr:hypothetical protein [Grimontia celer]CZF84678.1 hypothetical protein GCE9029_04544 [Grimontia celer]